MLPSALLAPLLEDQRVCVTAYFCFFQPDRNEADYASRQAEWVHKGSEAICVRSR